MRRLLLVPALLALCAAADATDARTKYHTVKAVPSGDRVVVKYEGLSITVRLAHLTVPEASMAEAKRVVEAMAKGQRVRVSYSEEVGLDDAGVPRAYIIIRPNRNVNEALVKAGLARYEPGGVKKHFYDSKMNRAQATAKKKGSGLWGGGDVAVAETPKTTRRKPTRSSGGGLQSGRVYSQINNSLYHIHTCRWAKKISPQRRIQYRDAGAAEKAGKRPCFTCMSSRAEEKLFGKPGKKIAAIRGKGAILSYNGQFHGPTCERILKNPSKVVSLKSFEAGRSVGLQPCERCLRLGGGMIPMPEDGECSGRAPPQRRPCRRAPADDSGLCLLCQGRE